MSVFVVSLCLFENISFIVVYPSFLEEHWQFLKDIPQRVCHPEGLMILFQRNWIQNLSLIQFYLKCDVLSKRKVASIRLFLN